MSKTTIASSLGPPSTAMQKTSIAGVLDRVLDTGVVAAGDIRISVADVDLLYIGLHAIISSISKLKRTAGSPVGGGAPAAGGNDAGTNASPAKPVFPFAPLPPAVRGSEAGTDKQPPTESPAAPVKGISARAVTSGPVNPPAAPDDPEIALDPERLGQDLAKLVLALVELLRQLMESRALERMDDEDLAAEQIERLGQGLMEADRAIDVMCEKFNLSREDLNIDLGPLGQLLDDRGAGR